MRKLLAIICVLLVIFIGMYVYKTNINQNNVTVSEVLEIEQYISKIYMWQEITEEALPKFDNINDAPDLWIWEFVKKNLDNYELTYEEIQGKAIEIFGDGFNKQFPRQGTQYIEYNEELDKYIAAGIGLDTLDDSFYIKDIRKIYDGYSIQIVEYLQDYKNSIGVEDENEVYDIYIKNLNEDTVATIKSNESETRIIEAVKENIDEFSTKNINLIRNKEGKIYIESVK